MKEIRQTITDLMVSENNIPLYRLHFQNCNKKVEKILRGATNTLEAISYFIRQTYR
jgi:hypothetical protein